MQYTINALPVLRPQSSQGRSKQRQHLTPSSDRPHSEQVGPRGRPMIFFLGREGLRLILMPPIARRKRNGTRRLTASRGEAGNTAGRVHRIHLSRDKESLRGGCGDMGRHMVRHRGPVLSFWCASGLDHVGRDGTANRKDTSLRRTFLGRERSGRSYCVRLGYAACPGGNGALRNPGGIIPQPGTGRACNPLWGRGNIGGTSLSAALPGPSPVKSGTPCQNSLPRNSMTFLSSLRAPRPPG